MAEQTSLLPLNKTPGRSGSPKRPSFVLGRRGSLMVSAGVAGHTLWTSAAPASDFTRLVFPGNSGPTASLMFAANTLIDAQLSAEQG